MNRIWILGLFLGIPALAEDEPEKLERPHFTMFGFTVHADNIDLNLGEAKGDVVAVGTVEGKPITVKADLLKVNLAEQSVLLSGWPSVIMKGAGLMAKSAETTVKLTKQKYTVQGPAAFTLDLKKLKERSRNPPQ